MMEIKLEKILKSINRDNIEKIEYIEAEDNIEFYFKNKEKTSFKDIAKILLTHKIVKGSNEYYITDIEFYLYCDEHKDTITHIRNCSGGKWFLHRSGVDIAFESKNVTYNKESKQWKKEKDAFYGGILIRGIKPLCETLTNKDLNGHPINVRDELFCDFDVFDIPQNFPILQNDNNYRHSNKKPLSSKRENIKQGKVNAKYRYYIDESQK